MDWDAPDLEHMIISQAVIQIVRTIVHHGLDQHDPPKELSEFPVEEIGMKPGKSIIKKAEHRFLPSKPFCLIQYKLSCIAYEHRPEQRLEGLSPVFNSSLHYWTLG